MAGKIMIIAGEASGDLHGGKLVASLRNSQPDLEIFGIGGDRMQAEGMELLFHVKDLAFMGFSEVVKHLGDIRKIFDQVVAAARQRRPDIVVLIDYPGFNLRLGKKLKSHGFKIFYFIAPQVWAWRQGRAKKMASFIDRMAVLFDFEVEFFARHGIDAHFVGHPLVEGMRPAHSREDFFSSFGLPNDAQIIGLFPGSRNQEIDQLLPTMIHTAQQLVQKHPRLVIAISQADTISDEKMRQHLGDDNVIIVKNAAYDLMAFSRAAMVASGTATLEVAALETPFAILYKVSPLSFFIGKRVVKIPFIGLVNIVAGKKVVNEFIQEAASPAELVPELERCLFDENYRQKQLEEFKTVREKLGGVGASDRTASLILKMISMSE